MNNENNNNLFIDDDLIALEEPNDNSNIVLSSIDDSACVASLAERKNAPREAGHGLLTITAIFSHFDKTHALANGYSERWIVFVRVGVADGGIVF